MLRVHTYLGVNTQAPLLLYRVQAEHHTQESNMRAVVGTPRDTRQAGKTTTYKYIADNHCHNSDTAREHHPMAINSPRTACASTPPSRTPQPRPRARRRQTAQAWRDPCRPTFRRCPPIASAPPPPHSTACFLLPRPLLLRHCCRPRFHRWMMRVRLLLPPLLLPLLGAWLSG